MPDNQVENAPYSEKQIIAIERSLSSDRFNSYLTETNGDKCKAIRLYEYNTEMSEALYGVIQGLEVTLRNSIHRSLYAETDFEDWFNRIPLQNKETETRDEARKAIEELCKDASPPRMIAQLNFGFWVRLTSASYEKQLWVPYLYKIFPMKMLRSLLYKRLLKIKELRNQIAHHERILKRNLNEDYRDILEFESVKKPN